MIVQSDLIMFISLDVKDKVMFIVYNGNLINLVMFVLLSFYSIG